MTTVMMGSRNSVTKTNGFIKAIDIYLGICFSFIFGALVEYAVAHYIASQKGAAARPQKVRNISDCLIKSSGEQTCSQGHWVTAFIGYRKGAL